MKKFILPLVFLIIVYFFYTNLNNMSTNFYENVTKIKPAVVMIIAETNKTQLPFTGGEYLAMQNKIFSKGTGFIVTSDGYIITANHVVKEAKEKITVRTFENNQTKDYKADFISSNNSADIALLKINVHNSVYTNLGDYNQFTEGMDVGFIGFPLTMEYPLTSKGIISAKGNYQYNEEGAPDIFMINAFVNQGNSGGPVFSAETGEVIGIINARMNVVDENKFIKYNGSDVKISGIDPIALSIETYNMNLKFIGDVTQVGIGYSTSIEYAKNLLKSVKK